MSQWRRQIPEIITGVLVALVVLVVTGVIGWLARLPAPVLIPVAIVTVATSLATVIYLVRRRASRVRLAVAQYFLDPPQPQSELLPVGPGGEQWTSVGEILDTPGLVVPQPFTQLRGLGGPTQSDLVAEVAVRVTVGESALIVGEPGIGKSLMARRTFEALVRDRRDSVLRGPVPVLIALADSNSDGSVASARSIFDLSNWIATLLKLSPSDLNWLVRRHGVLVLVDALDESPELTGNASVRSLLSSAFFNHVRLVTTRKDTYTDLSSLASVAHRFSLVAELNSLPFDQSIIDFVDAYCRRFRLTSRDDIVFALQTDESLRDLVTRPLLLWMTVDTLASLEAIEVNSFPSLTSLYHGYSSKWLRLEAAKADALTTNLDDRRTLVRAAARAMFRAGVAVGGGTLRSTTELAVTRNALAETIRADPSGALVASLVTRYGLDRIVDEVCEHTFLVCGNSTGEFRFAHKSFFEYFVACDFLESLKEGRLEVASEYCSRPLSDPIIYFMREMLSEAADEPEVRRIVCQGMFEILQTSRWAIDDPSLAIRQHIGNLIPGVLDSAGEAQLVSILESEKSKFVRRGIVVGLGLQRGRQDLVDAYVKSLDSDGEAASIQLGYSRIYHGDQEWGGTWEDDGSPEVSQTVRAQIDRLTSFRNRDRNSSLWALTVFTIRKLIQDGRAMAYLEQSPDAVAQLMSFVRIPRPDMGDVFEDQRKRLGASLDELAVSAPNLPRHQ